MFHSIRPTYARLSYKQKSLIKFVVLIYTRYVKLMFKFSINLLFIIKNNYTKRTLQTL